WLTCVRAGEEHAYSGWLFLYGETIFSVSAADRRALPELGPGPRADRRAIAERFRRNVSPRVSAAGWIVYDRFLKANRVQGGAARRAGASDDSLRNLAASAGSRPPRPISTSTPTMRRTIFQRKCDPSIDTRMRSPSSMTSSASTRTSVDLRSGVARASWSPAS